MTLTPLDIENAKLRGAFSGYNRSDVDQLLALAAQELEGRLRQIEDLQRRIAELEQTVANYRESEDLLKNSVVLAQRTSDEIIAAAHQQADAIKREAEGEGRETRRRLAELRSEREQFEYAFHGLLAGFLRRLEHGNPELGAATEQHKELQAPAEGEGSSTAVPDSHSRQLLREASEPGSAGGTDMPERIPDVPGPTVPEIPDVPQPAEPKGPDSTREDDEFERAIEEARPVPRQHWPEPRQSGDEDGTANVDDTDRPDPVDNAPSYGVPPDDKPGAGQPANMDESPGDERGEDDRLPLD